MEFGTLPVSGLTNKNLDEPTSVALFTEHLLESEVIQYICGGADGLKRVGIALTNKRLLLVPVKDSSKVSTALSLKQIVSVKRSAGSTIQIQLPSLKTFGVIDKPSAEKLESLLLAAIPEPGARALEVDENDLLIEHLLDSEEIQYVCSGNDGFKSVTIALTNSRLLLVSVKDSTKVLFEANLNDLVSAKLNSGKVIQIQHPSLKTFGVIDQPSAEKLESLLLAAIPEPDSRAMVDGADQDSEEIGKENLLKRMGRKYVEKHSLIHAVHGMPIGFVSGKGSPDITIYKTAIVCGNVEHPFDKYVSAEVIVDGQEVVTYRPTLTRMLIAGAVPGAGTAVFGLASRKKSVTDTRVSVFTIAHPDWSHRVEFEREKLAIMKSIATKVNLTAERIADEAEEKRAQAVEVSPTNELADRLKKLDDLLKQGLISKEEFEKLRLQILSDV